MNNEAIDGCEKGTELSVAKSDKVAPFSSPDALHDQAVALYMKLRALHNNPGAATEASAAIHCWISSDPMRRTAYDQVREVWHRQERYRINPHTRMPWFTRSMTSPASPSVPDAQSPDESVSLGWPDVVLMVCVFLLLLPMIYFLAVPVGR